MKKVLLCILIIAPASYFCGLDTYIARYITAFKQNKQFKSGATIGNFKFMMNNFLLFGDNDGVVMFFSPNPFIESRMLIIRGKIVTDKVEFKSESKPGEITVAERIEKDNIPAIHIELWREGQKYLKEVAFYEDDIDVVFFGKKDEYEHFRSTFESVRIIRQQQSRR